MKNLIITTLLIFLSTFCVAQKMNTKKLDSLFQILEQNDKFMGSIAVTQNGVIIYKNTIGFRNLEDSIKSNNNTKYRIGSVSKMFTATLVLKAIEENKLKLDQSLKEFYPQVKNSELITIKNLLNHSSGIHDFTSEKDYLEWNTKNQSKDTMIARIINGNSEFKPNEKSKYSNSNYVLLTFILEDIYGRSFSKLLNEKIVDPLHLENTFYGRKINIENNESNSYSYLGKWKLEPETNFSIPKGAGAVVSNPTDLNIFIEQLFLGNIVSKYSLEMMKTIENDYGFGMFKFSYLDELNFGHTGGIDGFQSFTIYFPNDKLAISMTSNGLNYPLDYILIPVSKTFHKKSFKLPKFDEIKVTSENLDKYLGTYSSEEIPPKIVITKEDNTLIAQASGQSAFPLEPISIDTFVFKPAGVKVEFKTDTEEMIMKQGGKEFLFSKE